MACRKAFQYIIQSKFNIVVVKHMSNIFLNPLLLLEFKHPCVLHTKILHSPFQQTFLSFKYQNLMKEI